MKMDLAELQNYAKQLANRIAIADAKLDMAERISKAHEREAAALRYAPSFFQRSREALITDATLSLSKLYEYKNQRGKHRSDRNLKRFLRCVEQHLKYINPPGGEISPTNIANDMNEIERHSEQVESILDVRSSFYAHFDKQYFDDPHQINEDHPVDFDQMRSLINLARSITERYYAALCGSDKRMSISHSHDVEAIFKAIDEHEDMTKERAFSDS